jgi:hypothetical protein
MLFRFLHALALASLLAVITFQSSATCPSVPVAGPDFARAFVEPVTIDTLANDSDPDGHRLTVTLGANSCAGSATVDALGLVTFTPSSFVDDTCTIAYTLVDETGNSATSTITIERSSGAIFADGFESENTSTWSTS